MPISPQIVITPEDIVFKSFSISAVTYTASTAIYTATGHTLSTGDIVTITGLAPDGYNGTYTITDTTTNTFTVTNTTNTALTDQAGNVYWADATEYEYDGGQTVSYLTNNNDVSTIIDTNSTIAAIQTTVDGKNKIFRQATAPTATAVGDIWFDTDDGNKQYYWTGTAWVSVQDDAIATAKAVADSKIKTFYQASTPTASGVGDIWFDTDEGFKQYYWNGTSWLSVQDTSIATAQSAAVAAASAAGAAQTTADGKNKVFRQTAAPTASAIGDIWFDTDDGNRIYRWDGSSWVPNNLGNAAIDSLSANKLTAGTIDASVITVSNINAGNISTGTLAADRIAAASITGAKIAAATIEASNIVTGTITATQIAASTITGAKIAAATIVGDNIAANTITASKIAAATITATEIAAGTITTDKLSAGTLTGFTIQTSSGNDAVIMTASTNSLSFKAGGTNRANMVPLNIGGTTYGVLLHAGSTPDPTGGTFPQLYISPSNIAMSTSSGGTGALYSISQNLGHLFQGQPVTVNTNTTFNGTSNSFPNITQSTAAANLRWGTTTNGRIFESTASSARFKTDIVNISEVDELNPKKLLDLPVHAFRYKDDYLGEEDERSGALVPGFIAEEVDQFYPIAADYELGQPNNWNDKFMIPSMLALIQELYKEIKLLKGE